MGNGYNLTRKFAPSTNNVINNNISFPTKIWSTFACKLVWCSGNKKDGVSEVKSLVDSISTNLNTFQTNLFSEESGLNPEETFEVNDNDIQEESEGAPICRATHEPSIYKISYF